MLITFLSDFGLDDGFVGVCHGVMKRIAPEAEILDLSHGVPPQDVLRGALMLADALPYLPAAVHLAVVDPGVGSERRGVALRAGEHLFVGPDNGLLLLAAERAGGVTAGHELANPAYRLESVSRTFHGRDVFAPAVAHLARGVPLDDLGPHLDAASLVRLDLPPQDIATGSLTATVIAVDRFGNVELNTSPGDLAEAGLGCAGALAIDAAAQRIEARLATTFADVEPGQPLVYESSSGRLAIAVAGGSATETYGLRPGARVRLGKLSR